jgi:hypothetical protein
VSGLPRIAADLRGDGEVISRRTIAPAMLKFAQVSVCRVEDDRSHQRQGRLPAVKPKPARPRVRTVLVGDTAYLRTWQGGTSGSGQ